MFPSNIRSSYISYIPKQILYSYYAYTYRLQHRKFYHLCLISFVLLFSVNKFAEADIIKTTAKNIFHNEDFNDTAAVDANAAAAAIVYPIESFSAAAASATR